MTIQIKSSEHTMMSDINVTPLVDVMLVLLIVFIVTAPLLIQAVPVKLPKTAASLAASPTKQIQLSIDSGGNIYLDNTRVDGVTLERDLAARAKVNPELNVELKADERVAYGAVAQVMGIVQQAGISRLSFITLSDK